MVEYIEREAACMEAGYIHGFGDDKYVSLKDIESIPAADVVPVVHGRWIEKYDLYDKGFYISSKIWWECSSCGMKTVWRDEAFNEKCGYNYCPNCGARMDGE